MSYLESVVPWVDLCWVSAIFRNDTLSCAEYAIACYYSQDVEGHHDQKINPCS